MRKTLLFTISGIFVLSGLSAQSPADKAVETFLSTIGTVSLGIGEYDFFLTKSSLKRPEDPLMSFREEVVETVGKNGLNSITYYFDSDEAKPLYEFIIEFADEPLRRESAEKLLGPPNYPNKPDHWISGGEGNVVTVSWAFGNKLVIAANIPGTEWTGDTLFRIPAGFEMYKHLPGMSEWPEKELTRFVQTLEKQVAAGKTDFSTIRSDTETDGFYDCTAPLAGAEASSVFKNDQGLWTVSNTLISGANAENSILWKLDAAEMLGQLKSKSLTLSRTKSRPGHGTTVDWWNVNDASGKSTGVQVGLVLYEWGAEGLWSIDVIVSKEP